MNKYGTFIFKNYTFDKQSRKLELFYSYDNILNFRESYHFDFEYVEYDKAALDRALQLLFLMAGVSYYKAFLAPKIVIEKGDVDERSAQFLNQTYQKGLGEFFFVNKLDPRTPIIFPVNTSQLKKLEVKSRDIRLVGIGGGKDSLVSVEMLRKNEINIQTWSLNHRPQLTPLVDSLGTQHFWVEREWDPQLFALKKDREAYSGHVPISAIFACVGSVVAILGGARDVVVSNESSANEPNLHYEGVAINHQYSKSLEFEQAFQAVLQHNFGNSLRYYSFLRPLSELYIAEIFSFVGFKKYKNVFSSCNRAFVHGNQEMFWDGECPKCAFVFLALTPFINRSELETLFHGKNLLLDKSLHAVYRQLLGIDGDKPLECVGEIKESRAAMRLAQNIYSELNAYRFELPPTYDYKSWGEHAMSKELSDILKLQLSHFK